MRNIKDLKPIASTNATRSHDVTDDQVLEIVEVVDWILDNYEASKVGVGVFKYLDKEGYRPSIWKDIVVETFVQYMRLSIKIATGTPNTATVKLPSAIAIKLEDYYSTPRTAEDVKIIPTAAETAMLLRLRKGVSDE